MTPKIRDGKISHRRLAINTSTREKSLPAMSRKAGSFTKCSLHSRAAPPTPPASRQITSITRMQSMQFFCSLNANGLQCPRKWLAERSLCQAKKRSEEHTSELQSPYDLVCRL